MKPNTLNLTAITECMLSQTYTEVHAFLGLLDHYRGFIKGFACIVQPLSEHLAGEDVLKAFEALKQVCMTAPILALTDASKDGLGAVL